MKYKKLNTSETNSDNDIILDNGTVFLDPNNDLKISDGVTPGGKNLIKRVQDITVSSGTIISTANTDQDLTITTNGAGDIFIGADKNMIFDMNAFSAKGILLQDSQEDGYDNPGTPSTLKIGSIYHDTGTMVISSDGSIINASGVQVNGNGDPSENPVYGGLWLTNGQDTGFKVPAQSGSFYGALSPNVEIHNNNKVWYFTDDGIFTIPNSGEILFYNNATLAQGTFDNGTNGNGGISLNCSVGYELNWQGGRLKSTNDNGVTAAEITVESPISVKDNINPDFRCDINNQQILVISYTPGTETEPESSTYTSVSTNQIVLNDSYIDPLNPSNNYTNTMTLAANGITFPDGSVQTSASSTTVVDVTFNTTINTNASSGDIFDITLTDNATLANPTNPVNGKTLRWRITQDGNGNRSISLGDKFNIPSSATSPLPWSADPNKMDVLAATYHAGRDKWDIVAFVPGY